MRDERILDIRHLRMQKASDELHYWMERKSKEGTLKNRHFEFFFTSHFGLDKGFYAGKRVLDVGCGPRGSLEWLEDAAERVGLDPLERAYRRLGTGNHRMRYVCARAEHIPLSDWRFDVVSCFDVLSQVDLLDRTADEIARVTAPGGLFLLLTEVRGTPVPAGHAGFSWEVVQRFVRAFRVLEERHYEYADELLFGSVRTGLPYDHSDQTPRCGILSAKLRKRTRAARSACRLVPTTPERMACAGAWHAAQEPVAVGSGQFGYGPLL